MLTRIVLVMAVVWSGISTHATPAAAQYPNQPIKVIVPFAAGGIVDSTARVFADKMSVILGQPMVIENRSGAGGKIGEDAAALAAPDGYNILVSFVIRPTVTKTAPTSTPDIDMEKAFTVVGALGTSPTIMNVPLSLEVSDFPALLQKVRANPNKFSYGSIGRGTASYIISEQLLRYFKLDVVHVPYRGASAALADLAAGQISWSIDTPGTAQSLIDAGKIKPIFVINATRTKRLPDVPTLAELGYPELNDQTVSIFMFVPVKTPEAIVKTLNDAVMQVQKEPEVINRLESLALIPAPPGDLKASKEFVAREIGAWQKAVDRVIGQ